MATKQYQSVLGWGSPFEMSCKLENEITRMREAKELRDFVEHTMNFALTAYHMIDWVWEAVHRNAKGTFERDQWEAAIGFALPTFAAM